jgi:hypothetical protein
MGVLDGNNNIYIQVWNGRTWTIPAGGGPLATTSTSCTTAPVGRCFQLAYEYTSDVARIVYQNNTRDPQYATWNGTTLAANGMVLSPSGAYSTAGSGTRHFWFRLAPRNVVGSNEILLMSFDSGQDVYGARWTGSAWNNMGTAGRWDTSTGTTNNREAIDVAWQSDGNTALFIWGDQNDRRVRYRVWTESTGTLAGSVQTTLTFPGGYVTSGTPGSRFEWLRLYPGPANVILVMLQTGIQTTGPALLSVVWSAGAFASTTAVGHDNGTVESDTSRAFDFAWETAPGAAGRGWLLWGSRTGGPGVGLVTRYFTSPGTWSAPTAIRDRSYLVQSGALLPSGRFVSTVYQATASANDDIESVTTVGGGTAWPNTATTLWAGPTSLLLGARVFIATRDNGFINTGASGTGVVSVLQQREIVQ